MGFGRIKVDPLKVGELLSILHGIGHAIIRSEERRVGKECA